MAAKERKERKKNGRREEEENNKLAPAPILSLRSLCSFAAMGIVFIGGLIESGWVGRELGSAGIASPSARSLMRRVVAA
jgi:hypothetical protein